MYAMHLDNNRFRNGNDFQLLGYIPLIKIISILELAHIRRREVAQLVRHLSEQRVDGSSPQLCIFFIC